MTNINKSISKIIIFSLLVISLATALGCNTSIIESDDQSYSNPPIETSSESIRSDSDSQIDSQSPISSDSPIDSDDSDNGESSSGDNLVTPSISPTLAPTFALPTPINSPTNPSIPSPTSSPDFNIWDAYAGIQAVTNFPGLKQGIVTGRIYNKMMSNPSEYFDKWHDMNLPWIRIEFEEYIQGAPATSAQNYKNLISEAHKRGIKVLGIISINSISSNKSDFPKSEASIKTYINEVKKRIVEYKVDAVEVCNEPYEFVAHRNNENLQYYANLLVRTYEELKPLFPSVIFVAPVTANAEMGEWLGRDWKTGKIENPEHSIFNASSVQNFRNENSGKLPLDVISWHPYGTGGSPTGDFYFGRSFSAYYKEILAYKDIKGRPIIGNYPIWFTEYGWEMSNFDDQNTRYKEMLKEIKKYPQIEIAFWYTWQDDERNVSGTENKNYGLIEHSGKNYREKPIYFTFFAENSLVGKFGNSINTTIINAYINSGGRNLLGGADSEVKRYNNISYQIFSDTNSTKSFIFHQDGNENAFSLGLKYYDLYMNTNGTINQSALADYGNPTSEFIPVNSSGGYITTTKGRVILNNDILTLN